MEIDADQALSLDAYIDVHSHSNSRAGFLYMNPLPTSHSGCAPLLEYLYRLPRVMAATVPGFQLSKCCCSTEAAKSSCGRRAAGMNLPSTLCYTFEISFFNAAEDVPASSLKTTRATAQSSAAVRSYVAYKQGTQRIGDRAVTPALQSGSRVSSVACRMHLLWITQIPSPDTMTWAKTLPAPSSHSTISPATVENHKEQVVKQNGDQSLAFQGTPSHDAISPTG